MRKTGVLYDESFLRHRVDRDHPELPDRLVAAVKGIQERGLSQSLPFFTASPAKYEAVTAVHDPAYLSRFEEACLSDKMTFGHPDNQICYDTYDTAFLAAGGVIEMTTRVMEGTLDNAFCAVRPPGHHAEHNKAMGFCYFNNVAIAARHIQRNWGIGRIGIIDFDVHHGNGTQHIFEDDPTVFFYSIHEHPSFSFPGTGREFEKGTGAGVGYTLNTPVLPGMRDEEYKKLFAADLFPAFDAFQPEVILVSAGFDAHADDDMSGVMLSTDAFTWITKRIMELADRHANGRLISILEGGYVLARLPELVGNHVQTLHSS